MLGAQSYEYSKNPWIIYCKVVTFVECGLYLNFKTAVKFNLSIFLSFSLSLSLSFSLSYTHTHSYNNHNNMGFMWMKVWLQIF